MDRTEIEEEILGAIAEATVSGGDAARLITKARGIDDPLIEYLVNNAVNSFARDHRAEKRLRLKVLQLDPSHYERLSAANEARQRRYEASPEGRRNKLKREEQRRREDASWKESMNTFNAWREKIDAALSFYESWHLSDGTPLGLAKKSQLLAEAEREEIIASGHHKNVVFYRSLASRLSGEQNVQEAVPLDEAHRLRERAYVDERMSDAA